MSVSAIEELLKRIHTYVLKVTNDPNVLKTHRHEYQAAVDGWKTLIKSLPGGVGIGAEEFEKYLLSIARMDAHDKKAFAAKWLHGKPPHSIPTHGQKAVSPQTPSVLVQPRLPGPGASPAELATYQKDLAKYNRMFEMLSKIMANSHEMKKALISNIR